MQRRKCLALLAKVSEHLLRARHWSESAQQSQDWIGLACPPFTKELAELREADVCARSHTSEPGFAPEPLCFSLCRTDPMKGKEVVTRWPREEWHSRWVEWRGQRFGGERRQCIGGPAWLKPRVTGRPMLEGDHSSK